ncbi:MAG: HYR domain-containing protein [Phycisphaerae bacterium]
MTPWVVAGCLLFGAGRMEASDVSLPVQVTSSGFYERGQSIVFDGAKYWLFYGRSATVTAGFQAGNPDINDYAVYYKTASSVAGLAAAPPAPIAGAGVLSNANSYLGETGSAVWSGEVWAFASIDLGASADVYGWFFDGVNWNEVASMATGLSNGSAHHDEIVFNGELFMLLRRSNFMTTHTATPKTGGWSPEVPVGVGADAGGGLAHFFIDAGKLYMAVLRSSVPRMNFIFEYDAVADAWLKVAETASAGWDPTLFKVGGAFVFAQAPFSADGGGRQWVIQWSNSVLDASFFSGGSKLVTEGKFGMDTWIDMWPIGFTDNLGDTYLFYTSERKPGAPGTEIAGNIWQVPVEWDLSGNHHTYVQEAVDAAVAGGTIGIATGSYIEDVAVTVGVTLAGMNPPDGAAAAVVSGTIQVLADGAAINGLKVNPGSVVGGGAGILINASQTAVTNAIVDGLVGDGTGTIKGIHVFGGSLLTDIAVTDNIITNIDNPPSLLGGFSGADGISVQGVLDGVQVVGNSVQNVQSAGWAFGVEVTPTAGVPSGSPQNVWVGENSISTVNLGIVHGVDVLLDPQAAPFPGVGLSLDETTPGAADGDASQVTVAGNAFEGVPLGVLNKDVLHVLNASGNWWGGSDPAVVAMMVLGAVDYTPWLGIGTDISPSPGFQGSFSTLFVDDDSTQVGLVGRIGEGLESVTGSTVNVAPGVYGPTVVIGDATPDGLVLQGIDAVDRAELLGGVLFDNDTVAQNGVTLRNLLLKGNADPDVSLETIVSMDNLAPVSDLTIDNCVFDGEGVVVGAEGANGRFGFNGNLLTGALTVVDSEFRNIGGWSVLNTDFSFVGPPIGGGELPFTAITLADNSIHDNNGTVVLRGRHDARTPIVDVHGNTWQNIGGRFLQTGQHWAALEVNHADVLHVTGNVVSNVVPGIFGEGQALQVWDVGTVEITSNAFIDNAQGLFVFGGGVVFGGPFAIPGGMVEFNTILGNADFGLLVDAAATGLPLNAQRNWWGAASGPLDASGVDEADAPLCFDPATMVNADGGGNSVSDLNVDYCPWLRGPVTLSLNPDTSCLTTIGQTLTVTIDATFLTSNVVGGQFFLSYDNTALAFVSADPGDPLFAEFSEFVDEVAGTIDYVVTAPPGDPGTSADVTMAVLTFTTLSQACVDAAALVSFRPMADPPTQLSALGGAAVLPVLHDLSAVRIDVAPPAVNALALAGGAVDGGCEALVTFSAIVTDNCCVLADDVSLAVALTTGNAQLGVPNVVKVQTDDQTVTITGDVLVSALSSCPATVEVAIVASDCCANLSAAATVFGDVNDATAPVLVVPPVATIECSLPTDPANTGQATATDNCDVAPVVSFSDAAPAGVCPVVFTRTWTATDLCGNSTSADQVINVDDTTPPAFVSFPPDTTIECDESLVPAIEYGTAGGGIAVYYNDNDNQGMGGNGEHPANRAFLKAQFDGTKSLLGAVVGAPYLFSNTPLSGGSLFSWQILYSGLIWPESQFGLDLVTTLPTADGSVPTPLLHAFDNVDGTVANRSLVGPVTWALNDYKPHLPDISAGDVINSLIRSQSPADPLTDLEITRLDVTGAGPVFTMEIAGKLQSDGNHHWFTPSTPDSPMLDFGLNGEFYFHGTLTYDSTGDDGTDLINFYAGSLTVLANSPNAALGVPVVDDNCDSFPELEFSDDTSGLTGCNGTGTIVRTWTTVDACGNTASANQVITIQDSTPPEVVCPADITVSAEAPGCGGAAATFDLPTLTDNCDGAPLVACDWTSGATFPVGTTVVTCNATDACANAVPCTFQVTVAPTNEMVVAVEIGGGVIFPASFTRCITFELWDCSGGGPAAVASEMLTFTGGVAVGTITPACGVYACVTARDALHTLRTTDIDHFSVASGQYVADFTDQSAVGGDNDALVSGNLNDDFFIDILDFGVFSAQWLINYGSGDVTCATSFPHADVNGDGVVNNAELSFIQINFLQPNEANCCGAEGASASGQGPVAAVSVKALRQSGRGDLAAGDLNGDGWLDQEDIAAFMAGVRPRRRPVGHDGGQEQSLGSRFSGDRMEQGDGR